MSSLFDMSRIKTGQRDDVSKHATHYVFHAHLPIDLHLYRTDIPGAVLKPFRITPVNGITVKVDDIDKETGFRLVEYTARQKALELQTCFATRGVVWLPKLTLLNEAELQMVVEALIPGEASNTVEFEAVLEQARVNVEQLPDALRGVAKETLDMIANSLRFAKTAVERQIESMLSAFDSGSRKSPFVPEEGPLYDHICKPRPRRTAPEAERAASQAEQIALAVAKALTNVYPQLPARDHAEIEALKEKLQAQELMIHRLTQMVTATSAGKKEK